MLFKLFVFELLEHFPNSRLFWLTFSIEYHVEIPRGSVSLFAFARSSFWWSWSFLTFRVWSFFYARNFYLSASIYWLRKSFFLNADDEKKKKKRVKNECGCSESYAADMKEIAHCFRHMHFKNAALTNFKCKYKAL